MPFKKDYSAELTPHFTAVEDVRAWIGEMHWHEFIKLVSGTKCTVCFLNGLTSLQIPEFPAQALYEHINGGKSWDKRRVQDLENHRKQDENHKANLTALGRIWAEEEVR